MATTKIWPVKSNIKKVIDYATNPDKTESPDYKEFEYQGLENAINYTTNDLKTHKQLYVSTLNCEIENASKQMQLTKKQFNKETGILAFHGYQSFAPGEVTAEQAHQIGIELANKLWGERFQVVVSTHLDKAHYHNHFVVNSVSFIDGKKFYASKKTYMEMRKNSDELCEKYSLSVIKNPKKGKHYAEWLAEQNHQPTWRSLIKQDIDICITQSLSYTDFINAMKKLGYEMKLNRKHIAMKHPNQERFIRLRSIGEEYTKESIKTRILENKQKPVFKEAKPKKVVFYYKGTHHNLTKNKIKGLRALYFHYLYKMKILPNKSTSNKEVHILLKQDILQLDKINRGAILLNKHRISTIDELHQYKDTIIVKMDTLIKNRKQLYNKLRRTSEEEKVNIKYEISLLSKEIFSLRKEVMVCDDIETRSTKMEQNIKQIKEEQKRKDGEKNHEQWRRSR